MTARAEVKHAPIDIYTLVVVAVCSVAWALNAAEAVNSVVRALDRCLKGAQNAFPKLSRNLLKGGVLNRLHSQNYRV